MKTTEARFLVQETDQVDRLLGMLSSAGLECENLGPLEVTEQYFDRPDFGLFQQGWTLRWSVGPAQATLRLASTPKNGGRIQSAEEIDQAVPALPPTSAELPEGPVKALLTSLGPLELREDLVRVQSRRHIYGLKKDGKPALTLSIDRAEVLPPSLAPRRNAPGKIRFEEVALTAANGEAPLLAELARKLERDVGMRPARLCRFERGLQSAGLTVPRRCIASIHPAPAPDGPLTRLVYHCLEQQFQELLLNENGAWEGLEPEAVHRMRVAVRRMREAFRTFGDVLPPRTLSTQEREFNWLGEVLGQVRDLDVYDGHLDRIMERLPERTAQSLEAYKHFLGDARRRAQGRLVEVFESRRYARLVERFGELLRRGPSRAMLRGPGGTPVADAGREILSDAFRKVRRRGRKVRGHAAPDDYHRLRIACKRLRYACEFFESAYPPSLGKVVQRMKTLQDVLGEHQDACVACERIAADAGRIPVRRGDRGLPFALGELHALHVLRAQESLHAYGKAWRKFDRRKVRRQFQDALGILQPDTGGTAESEGEGEAESGPES